MTDTAGYITQLNPARADEVNGILNSGLSDADKQARLTQIANEENLNNPEGSANTSVTEISQSQLNKRKIDALTDRRRDDVRDTETARADIEAMKRNAQKESLFLAGLKPDGTPDFENPQGFAYKMQDLSDNIIKARKDVFNATERAKLAQTAGTLRAMAAARGVNTSDVPLETVIGLSGDLGGRIVQEIELARADLIKDINAEQVRFQNQLMDLQTRGLANKQQVDEAITLSNNQAREQINKFNKEFVSEVMSIGDQDALFKR